MKSLWSLADESRDKLIIIYSGSTREIRYKELCKRKMRYEVMNSKYLGTKKQNAIKGHQRIQALYNLACTINLADAIKVCRS